MDGGWDEVDGGKERERNGVEGEISLREPMLGTKGGSVQVGSGGLDEDGESYEAISLWKSPFLFVLVGIAAIGGLEFGYDTGVVSAAILLIEDEFQLSPFGKEVFVSATIVGAILGSSFAGWASDRIGRKPVILIASVAFIVGASFLAFAWSEGVLWGGRGVVGLGIGISAAVVPVYLAETVPREIRGVLVSSNSLFITGGQFGAACIGAAFVSVPSGWRYMLGLAAVPALLQLIVFAIFLPESPVWLAQKGKDEVAAMALRRIWKGYRDGGEATITQLSTTTLTQPPESLSSTCEDWREMWGQLCGRGRKALLLGMALQLVQQLAGINVAMYYAGTILKEAGFSTKSSIFLNIAVAGMNFAATWIGLWAIERMGRRPLTLFSLGGVAVVLAGLTTVFSIRQSSSAPTSISHTPCPTGPCVQCILDSRCGFAQNGTKGFCVPSIMHHTLLPATAKWIGGNCPGEEMKTLGWVLFALILLYLLCFAPGMGITPWTLNAEIHAPSLRSVAASITSTTNWVSNLAVSFSFLTLLKVATPPYTFGIYTGIAVLGWIYFYFAIRETRGVPLARVHQLFQ